MIPIPQFETETEKKTQQNNIYTVTINNDPPNFTEPNYNQHWYCWWFRNPIPNHHFGSVFQTRFSMMGRNYQPQLNPANSPVGVGSSWNPHYVPRC